MNVSKFEVLYNPNQDHQLYTPVILTASLLAKDNPQLIIIRSIDKKVNNLNSGVDLIIDSKKLSQNLTPYSICQLLIKLTNKSTNLYLSNDVLQINLLVDLIDENLADLINNTDAKLANHKYLISSNLSLADLFFWSKLAYLEDNLFDKHDNLKKWFKRVENDVKSAISLLPKFKSKNFSNSSKPIKSVKSKDSMVKKEEGKYVDLPGAEMGKVVVRFPPEASGYLHIGHAKAALLNQYYQLKFNGKLIFRFDDTNPEKEKEDFEDVIREDVALLKIKPDICSYTSDYFNLYLEKCEYLIKHGKAYVDDTSAEQMKTERDQRVESKNRDNSVEKNLQMWNEMKQGTEYGQKCCVRAKIDMKSDNGSLRDPTLYRCKNAPHPKTGSKYKVYPTYDFACPIVDSIEGVTHSLRTTEYMDRDPQYYWVCDALGIRKPFIYAYSRLNLTHTVLSKRKLTWFVNNKIVSGWDDPRMPTVRGILRRGLTIDGLKDFIVKQGSSRSVVVMEWDKIWSLNRQVIDPKAVRFMGVEKQNAVKVNVENVDLINEIEVDCHPKNSELGKRKMKVSKQLLIDQIDAVLIKENEFVTFMNLGNILINKIVKDANGVIKEINGKYDPTNKDFKKTLKVTWLDSTNVIKAQCCYYENLIEKPILDKDNDEFKDYINKESEIKIDFVVEKEMCDLKKGDIIQVLRKGFFICDEPYDKKALSHTSLDSKIILISIADGTTDLNNYPKAVQDAKLRLREKVASFADSKKEKSAKNQPQQSVLSDADSISLKIKQQGDKIRSQKEAGKSNKELKSEVDILNSLKAEYKAITGQDWKPAVSPANQSARQPQQSVLSDADSISLKIKQQGDKIRSQKEAGKSNKELKSEVDILNSLKAEYKAITGQDWKPAVSPANQLARQPQQSVLSDADSISLKIKQQGDKIRSQKEAGKSNKELKSEVDILNAFKAEYKSVTGQDWKPAVSSANQPTKQPQQSVLSDADSISLKIKQQGDKIRSQKEAGKTNKELKLEVDILNSLKAEYKAITGQDWKPAVSSANQSARQQPSKEKPANQSNQQPKESGTKKQTKLGIEKKKSDNFSDWYTEVITKSEMVDYYDISGCYVLWEWSYGIWEKIVDYLDGKIKEEGVKNVGFPLFVSKRQLEVEKSHIADFAPEVAWVTKSGSSDLQEPIAIRPTSETVMYPYFAKRIKSHRDLPLKVNQWCNVVRWEFKDPTPFLRTREFYWQEGHTAHATKEEALKEVHRILDHYASTYEYLLAIPVIKGKKTEREKFPGGDITTTIEGFISENGRGIQAGTSHYLGQNFSKMFNIKFQNLSGDTEFAYQNSWGFTTRSIGVMVMEHSDNSGLVLPPRVAPIQVIIIPCGITVKTTEIEKQKLLDVAKQLETELLNNQIIAEVDASEHQTVGWKYGHYELKGVPIRIELGPKDLEKNEFVAIRRDTLVKQSMKLSAAKESIKSLLEEIQNNLFETAKKKRDNKLKQVENMDQFNQYLNEKCLILAPFCGNENCEELIKKATELIDQNGLKIQGAKSLCIPFDQPKGPELKRCVYTDCKLRPQYYTLFGRSY